MKKLLLLLVVLCAPAFAQLNWFPNLGAGAPSNPCGNQQIYVNTSNGDLYTCTAAAWVKTGAGGGAGTVTNVTFTGDGTILSSTPSSAVTASGTVSATAANAAAGTILANTTSSSAAPSYVAAISGTHFAYNGFWPTQQHDDSFHWVFLSVGSWIGAAIGAGSGNGTGLTATGADQNHTGTINVTSGTGGTGTGEGFVHSNTAQFTNLNGSNPWQFIADVYMSTLTSAYYAAGFSSSQTTIPFGTSDVGFFFDSTVSATNWQCRYQTTTTDSGKAATATTMTNLAITSDGTTVTWYINGVSACTTNTSNMPSAALWGIFQSVARSGSSVVLTVNDFMFDRKATKF